MLLFHSSYNIYIPTNSAQRFQFFHSVSNTCYFLSFLFAYRSNQSIPRDISPGCSLEGLMLKLKLQYFGHLMRRVDSFEKTWEGLRAGGEGDNRG